jgi:hypothetical protein
MDTGRGQSLEITRQCTESREVAGSRGGRIKEGTIVTKSMPEAGGRRVPRAPGLSSVVGWSRDWGVGSQWKGINNVHIVTMVDLLTPQPDL